MKISVLLILLSGILTPPEMYNHAPSKKIQVIEGAAAEVNRICRKLSKYEGNRKALACALPSRAKCVIIWPKHLPRSGLMWTHEIAHCNGWIHR